MKKLTSSQIRQMWLDFFKSKGHSVEPSASLVPVNDKTLLWTNAGVTPLKKYFDGTVVLQNPRITNAQKCIRTNDIENVGHTARHHTFFEMLGNFSIGDYFKNKILPWAYELLTSEKWFDFDINKLYITFYADDFETRDLWHKIGVPMDHLIPLEGNFWEIGEGPCGPDTEIFYDRGEKYDKRGKELIEQDLENDRFIEIWNIVFSQYNSKEGVKRENYAELPSKNIDTGCGLERVTCVMQGVDTNYDTDLFIPIIEAIEEISGIKYEGQMSFKVIADHIRTVTFAVADGAVLSNEGRGYVLRRVLRRATKHAKRLGINKPFMAELVDVVIKNMQDFYPYLGAKSDIVKDIVTKEEEKFLLTINNGEKKFEAIANVVNGVISGYDAFLLYDTFGFPYELTVEYAEERNLTVNESEFKQAMQEQKDRARNSRKELSSMGGQNEEFLNFKTESKFVGYDTLVATSKVIKVFKEGIILAQTPFYAFSGGQLCDTGTINDIRVMDVRKLPNGQHLHIMEENSFEIGCEVVAIVDGSNRDLTIKNHSSAHLLQTALKEIVGEHVHQQGSQVCSDYMRFDFNNYQSLTDEEILKIEGMVNKFISEAHEVITHVLPLDKAKKYGAVALFDEKYGDLVRVVDMGISKEFCAGTHVKNTSEINNFAINSFESIGSGIYRISAITGSKYMELLKNSLLNLFQDLQAIKNKALNLVKEAKIEGIKLDYSYNFGYNNISGYAYILRLREEIAIASKTLHDLEKTYQAKKSQNALSSLDKYVSLIENGAIITKTEISDSNLLKEMALALVNNKSLKAVVLAFVESSKVTFIAATNGIVDAGMLVKEAARLTGGSGGGKKNIAQAGGKDTAKVDEALDFIRGLIS